MEQHAVPQNVTGFQFKLIGDLTVKQFLYLAAGLALAYAFFAAPALPFYLKYPLAFIFGLLGIGFAFIPVQDRPMDKWIWALIKSLYSPTIYLWQKTFHIPEFFEYRPVALTEEGTGANFIQPDRKELTAYLSSLPSEPKTRYEQMEEKYLKSIFGAYGQNAPAKRTEEPTLMIRHTAVSGVDVHKLHAVDTTSQNLPATNIPPQTQPISVQPPPAKKSSPAADIFRQPVFSAATPPPQGATVEELLKKRDTEIISIKEQMAEIKKQSEELKKEREELTQKAQNEVELKKEVQELEKEKTQQAMTIEELVKFREELKKVKEEEETVKAVELKSAFEQNRALLIQIEELKNQMAEFSGQQAQTEQEKEEYSKQTAELQAKLTQTLNDKNLTAIELARLRNEISESKVAAIKPEVAEFESLPPKPRVRFLEKGPAQRVLPVLTNTPNTISGLVTGPEGDLLLGVILIIKDSQGNPLRALKTNKVGQFLVSTPLPNGIYTIELEKEDESFDIIEVELKGDVLPALEIKAKPK